MQQTMAMQRTAGLPIGTAGASRLVLSSRTQISLLPNITRSRQQRPQVLAFTLRRHGSASLLHRCSWQHMTHVCFGIPGRLGTPTHAGACPQVVRAGFYGAKGDKPPTRPGDGPNWLDQANQVGVAICSSPREIATPTRCLAALASLFPCCCRCGMLAHNAD